MAFTVLGAASASLPFLNSTPLTISAMAQPPLVIAGILADPAAAVTAVAAARTELFSILGLLIVVVALRTRLTILRALRAARRCPGPNTWLLVHIAIGFLELGRLQCRALSGQPVRATRLDLCLGLAHCLSSHQVLLRRTRAGYHDLIPLGMRVQPFLFRLCATWLAFATGCPTMHRRNIRLGFDSFLYARLLIYACTRLPPGTCAAVGLAGPRALHTFAAVLGGFVATWGSGIRHGTLAYVVCSAASMLLDARTSRFMASLSEVQEPVEQECAPAAEVILRKNATGIATRLHRFIVRRTPLAGGPEMTMAAAAMRRPSSPAIVVLSSGVASSSPPLRVTKVS
ncbi:hypothetical protein MN608_11750 [Microdochium nivale]|nr:hypothetical protein MN608_11750 [Microdochium nivale]